MEVVEGPSTVLIQTVEEADSLGRQIIKDSHFGDELVLGIDLEGLTKGRPLCLL